MCEELWPGFTVAYTTCVCAPIHVTHKPTHTHTLTRQAKSGAPLYGSISPSVKFRCCRGFGEEFAACDLFFIFFLGITGLSWQDSKFPDVPNYLIDLTPQINYVLHAGHTQRDLH